MVESDGEYGEDQPPPQCFVSAAVLGRSSKSFARSLARRAEKVSEHECLDTYAQSGICCWCGFAYCCRVLTPPFEGTFYSVKPSMDFFQHDLPVLLNQSAATGTPTSTYEAHVVDSMNVRDNFVGTK